MSTRRKLGRCDGWVMPLHRGRGEFAMPGGEPRERIACGRGERGMVLLILLFLAAVMLIGAASGALRLVTEGRRQHEEEMVWRGQQYVRAIRLYYRRYGQFPKSIEDFSKNPGNLHFLRQVYKDPMNSTDGNWRYIYVGPTGQLVGSLTRKLPIGMVPLGGVTSALGPGASTTPGGAAQGQGASPFGSLFGGPGGTGASGPGPGATGSSGFGSSSFGNSSFGSSSFGSGASGTNAPAQTGGASGTQIAPDSSSGQTSGIAQAFGSIPALSSDTSGGGTATAAGMPADFGTAEGSGQGGVQPPKKAIEGAQTVDSPVFGGQLVGIASKVDRKSIRFYKGYGKYREWEFIWDPAEDAAAAAGNLPTGTGGLPTGIGTPATGTQGFGGLTPPGNPPPTGTPTQPPQ